MKHKTTAKPSNAFKFSKAELARFRREDAEANPELTQEEMDDGALVIPEGSPAVFGLPRAKSLKIQRPAR